jgi:multidrug transporter EmrE-like cation transporter
MFKLSTIGLFCASVTLNTLVFYAYKRASKEDGKYYFGIAIILATLSAFCGLLITQDKDLALGFIVAAIRSLPIITVYIMSFTVFDEKPTLLKNIGVVTVIGGLYLLGLKKS